jgi:DNA-binding response OmpR family regulator
MTDSGIHGKGGGIHCGTLIAVTSDMTSMKVLIVDDNKLICLGLGRTLSRRNIVHHAVEDGKNALSEISGTFYDLVFLDIHLPDGNGLDLLREIRRISPATKVVILSSDGSENNVRWALAAGAVRFVEKPYEISEVMDALDAARPREPGSPPPNDQEKPIPGRTSGSGIAGTDT